ncbi:hypothetical protein MEX01_47780 [Methylorubrum extorquens]|nr:hypothetical protein MEX01_47780 [Methylorubrum extorquens]
MLDRLRRWARGKVCPGCDVNCDRLQRAERLHEISVDAVKAAQRKQARRLSDVRVVVEATIRQMDERTHRAEERAR